MSFGGSGDGDDDIWDPSQLDNDPVGPPSASALPPPPFIPPPSTVGSASVIGPPPVMPPQVGPPSVGPLPVPGGGIKPPSSVIKPPPFATRAGAPSLPGAPPLPGGPSISLPPPRVSPMAAYSDVPPPAGPIPTVGKDSNVLVELQKRQEMYKKQFEQDGFIKMPGGAGQKMDSPKPAAKPPVKIEPHPVPKTWNDFTDNKDFAKLLAGDDAEDKAREARAFVSTAKTLKVLVCGTASSKKSVWLTNFLGLLCVRHPTNDVMHARFKVDEQMYVLDFAMTDQMYASSEHMYRWAEAYVLVYDVSSRDSFESVKDLYRGIMEERGTVYVPIILVAIHAQNQTEDSWMIPRSEAVTLSDTLSIPFCVCCNPEEVHQSVKTLIEEVQKKEKKRAEGVNPDSKNMIRKDVNEFEIVLLGDAFVGKTTFMNRVFDHKFEPSYVSTTSKVIRKDQVIINGEKCMIKIVDTPWFSSAQQAAKVTTGMEGGAAGNQKGLMSASAMATIEWLKQQQLLQAQCFIILFSVTNRDSFILAQELVSQLQSALLYAPKSTNKVIFLIGTKTDQVHSTVVSPLELFQNAQRLGALSTTMSLKEDDRQSLDVVFERLLNGLRNQRTVSFKETFELDKQGTVVRGKGRGKSKQSMAIHDGLIMMNHNDKDEDMFPIDENSLLESFHSATDPKGQLYLHFVTGDKRKDLWIACSNIAERDSWEDCLRNNITVAQMAHMVTNSFVRRLIDKNLHEVLHKASPQELAPISEAMKKDSFCTPGKPYMFIEPVRVAKVSAKEAKKLEKEQEKEKKKAEKEQKEREKAEAKAEKKKK